jgi:NhaP-type Na+/H+ or K+/H+ antiporter
MQHGLPEQFSRTLAAVVLATVAVSAVAHGVSVTPLMKLYGRRSRREADRRGVTRDEMEEGGLGTRPARP